MCASTDLSENQHIDKKIDNSVISDNIRNKIMRETSNRLNYTLLIKSKPEYVKNISKKFVFGNSLFNLSDLRWNNAFLWK